MTHQLNLSLEAGRIANVINGKSFAIIGGRSNENHEDLARGKLLYEAFVLRRFQGAPTQRIPYAREHPMPPGWKGVMQDCTWSEDRDRRFTNWGEVCDLCNYWGPSLEKLEEAIKSGWICLNCKLEKEYLDDLEDKNPQDPLGLGYLKCNEITFSAVKLFWRCLLPKSSVFLSNMPKSSLI